MNARLARLGLPGIHQDLDHDAGAAHGVEPAGLGVPDVPGNVAYVEVVGDDLYDIRGHGAAWTAAEMLYKAHPSKPFAFPEWGLWASPESPAPSSISRRSRRRLRPTAA